MKQIYEEPNFEILFFDGTVIVSISGGVDENLGDDYDDMFN